MTHFFEAQLLVEGQWLGLYSLTPGGFPEGERAVRFDPVEESAVPELKQQISSLLTEHADKPMVVVTGNGDREYLFGPGQVGPFRFVFWE